MMKFVITSIFLVYSLFCIGANHGKRIVSLAPNITEIIVKLGRGNLLVGRSSACNYPEHVKSLPIIGDFGIPAMERMLAVAPDIVIATSLKDQNVKKNVESMGIRFLILPTDTIEDFFQTIEKLGKVLDCSSRAVQEIKRLRDGLKMFRQQTDKIALAKRPKVFVIIWDKPLMTVGRKSFITDLVEYAGGVNIACRKNKSYFNCSPEWLLMQKPDVIICPAMKERLKAHVLSHQGWEIMPAVRNNRVYTNIDDDLIYRLGPRILEGIHQLQKCITKR